MGYEESLKKEEQRTAELARQDALAEYGRNASLG